jgi:RNA polymerase sigma-70 factor, ECF subfamily
MFGLIQSWRARTVPLPGSTDVGRPTVTHSNQDAVALLFMRDRGALHRYVRRLLGHQEDSEDILQEAFLRTYRHAEKLVEPRAFVFTTARNLVADSRRRSRIAKTDAVGDLENSNVVGSSESLEDQLLANERRRLLEAAVARLSPQCRAAFTERVFGGCSYKEIAQQLCISPKTVENHIARALRETHQYMRQRYQLK